MNTLVTSKFCRMSHRPQPDNQLLPPPVIDELIGKCTTKKLQDHYAPSRVLKSSRGNSEHGGGGGNSDASIDDMGHPNKTSPSHVGHRNEAGNSIPIN
jgi:hypothetical protein